MDNKEQKLSKVGVILRERKISQAEFCKLIFEKTKVQFGKSRISEYVNGKKEFMTTETAKILAYTLGVSLDEVVDGWDPQKIMSAPLGSNSAVPTSM